MTGKIKVDVVYVTQVGRSSGQDVLFGHVVCVVGEEKEGSVVVSLDG